jgi:ABC-2 type transport system ATP-binding protein
MAIIEIDHLTKRFDDIVAVDDLTLEIADGEFFGLLGPNGAGKSTTLLMHSRAVRAECPDVRSLRPRPVHPWSRQSTRWLGGRFSPSVFTPGVRRAECE